MKKYDEIVKRLINTYPTDKCALNYSTSYELLVAVVLSAQCTDKRVNEVTKELFKIANTPKQMVALGEEGLYERIKSCGLGKSKAKNIIKASEDLLVKYNCEVPASFDELCSLAGVGEKTASVVLAVAFNVPAFAVDTHVFRVSNRIGLASEKSPHTTMVKLKSRINKDLWIDGHYALVLHGRNVCFARKPNCAECCIKESCKYYKSLT